MPNADFMKELVAFARDKGYIWGPSPEIYGGVSGFYTYAPLGKLLKNNVEEVIRKVFQRNDFWEVECPIVTPRVIWEASGHIGGFSDPLIKDEDGNHYRVDHLIKEAVEKTGENPDEVLSGVTKHEEFLALIKKYNITGDKGRKLILEIKEHNLLMPTRVGIDTEMYNRGETATVTYLPFLRYFDFFRKKLPFGVFQIGKAFRNEISPRQFTLRMREFTQAEAQLFIFKDQKNDFPGFQKYKNTKLPFWPWALQEKNSPVQYMTLAEARTKYMKNDAYAFCLAMTFELFESVGIPPTAMRLRQHSPKEKAFYAEDAWDVEVNLKSFGWEEICGIHDRTNYDLTQHAKHSKKELGVSDETHKKEIPHVLEIAFGTDRLTFVLLDLLFNPQEMSEGKTTFHIPYKIAPIKVAIYPLVKKDGMPEIAQEIYDDLSKDFVCVYDQSGSIGRRYLRAAEQGIPYCITIDGESKSEKTVTIRDRDTEKQERVPIADIRSFLKY